MGALAHFAADEIVEAARFQEVGDGFRIIDDLMAPRGVEAADHAHSSVRQVPLVSCPVNVLLVDLLFGMLVQVQEELQIGRRDANLLFVSQLISLFFKCKVFIRI